MTIRRRERARAGRADLDEPVVPAGLSPADRASLDGAPRWPTAPPPVDQPTAADRVRRQPLGTERPPASPTDPDDEHAIGDPAREDDRREEPDGGFSED